MADPKTEVVKQKIEETDQKVKDNIKNIENTKLGKNIPMEIKDISLHGLISILNFVILYADLAVYLLITGSIKNVSTGLAKATDFFTKMILICFYIIVVCGDMLAAGIFYLKAHILYKYMVLIKLIKMAIVIFVSFRAGSGLFGKLMSLIFGLITCGFDALYAYYLALYFERLGSDDFDDYGKYKPKPVEAEV